MSLTIIGWDAIVNKAALTVYTGKATRAGHMLAEDAKTQDLHFLDAVLTLLITYNSNSEAAAYVMREVECTGRKAAAL